MKKKRAVKKTARKTSAKKNSGDIIQIILKDHEPLKKWIKILKSPDKKISEKRPIYESFALSLLGHAKPEEESLYVHMKEESAGLRAEGFEGVTEHALAEQMITDINQTHDQDEWMAKVKVLAELIDHHIEEEEDEMFKQIKKEFDLERRVSIGEEYLKLKKEFHNELSEDMSLKSKRSHIETEKFI